MQRNLILSTQHDALGELICYALIWSTKVGEIYTENGQSWIITQIGPGSKDFYGPNKDEWEPSIEIWGKKI